MDKTLAMLEMKEDLLPMFRTTGRDWYCSWMPLKRRVTLARWEELIFITFVCSVTFAYISCGLEMQIKIGMDVAASEFLMKDGKYDLDFKKQPNDGAHVLSAQSLCELYQDFVREFPIVSIEDPFDQDDWSSWASLQSSVDIQLVGDDLLVTNPKRIAEAIQKKACNGLLLKASIYPLFPLS